MPERSVAEIIGWEWREISWPEVNYGGPADKPYVSRSHGYWAPPGQQVDDNGCEPNVDDMLAWLAQTGRLEGVEAHHTYGPFVQIYVGEPPKLEFFAGDTMLEVLEWAVRRLDESAALEHSLDVGRDHPLGDEAQ